ncbi:breast carcinoma amplified sequence 2 [Cristinia sonorae]|uniref:Breast carcinoma amplified sequence 2 n=1 Tax=Cristinia sonorae TaxID=1940300 RepID=A0A8K0UN96_9AGAR|nr:breast carcinoma amplified sequence 2 [Cristinia sonorae]
MSSDPEPSRASAIFDSLPYYDNDYERDPTLKDKAEKLIAKELANLKPQQQSQLHPRVPPPITIFANNPLLEAEMARIEAQQPFPQMDTLRYQLPGPASSPGTPEEWEAALKNARAQLEHQRLRQSNLALLQNYGANAWRIHNYLLETTSKNLDKSLEELKELTTEVNRDRKNFQTRLGSQLTSLETRWTELISNVLQIEMANVALEGEIERLTKKEAELAAM